MKRVAIVPIKQKSERVVGKNFRMVGKKPLYRYLLDRLTNCNFDEVYVDSDSEELRNYCEQMNYQFIERKPELALNTANGNDLLNYHAEIIQAELYFQLFITSPLLKDESINNCIQILSESKTNDSVLTVNSIYTWFWYDGKPVNYNPQILPRSQDAKPIIMETTGLYGITRKALLNRRARIGEKPYFYEVEEFESIDLDNEIDFKYLEYYVQNNFSGSNN